MAIGLLFLSGCSNEDSSDQIEQSIVVSDFVFNFDGLGLTWKAISLNEIPSNQNSSKSSITKVNKGNSSHAHGNFPGVEFSGTENNGGAHGSATVSLGPNTYTCGTECIMVEGNEAVYGGIITEVAGPPPPPGPGPPVYSPGDYVYFKVFDNGEGNNASPDQFYGRIKFETTSKCGIYTPGNTAIWVPTVTIPGYGTINFISNIPEPGSVKVNN